jgi:hypothetical protein
VSPWCSHSHIHAQVWQGSKEEEEPGGGVGATSLQLSPRKSNISLQIMLLKTGNFLSQVEKSVSSTYTSHAFCTVENNTMRNKKKCKIFFQD